MNILTSIRRLQGLAYLPLLLAWPLVSSASGIPEPSLVLYGKVMNKVGGSSTRLTFGQITWVFKPQNGGPSVVVSNSLANIHDQFSFVLQVPCETEIAGLSASPNTLKLPAAPALINRAEVLINGKPVAFTLPAQATMSLGPADRGRIERVDLEISLTPVDSDGNGLPDDWELAFLGGLGNAAGGDPDKDGASNLDEYKAGTDPNDGDSVFAFITIAPHPEGGVLVEWASVADRSYGIQRSGEILAGYATVASGQAATPPKNAFRDAAATGSGPYFYRLVLEQ